MCEPSASSGTRLAPPSCRWTHLPAAPPKEAGADGAGGHVEFDGDLGQRHPFQVQPLDRDCLLCGQPQAAQFDASAEQMPDYRLAVRAGPGGQLADRRARLIADSQLGTQRRSDRGLALLNCGHVSTPKVGDPPHRPLLAALQIPLLVPSEQGFRGGGEVWRLSRWVHIPGGARARRWWAAGLRRQPSSVATCHLPRRPTRADLTKSPGSRGPIDPRAFPWSSTRRLRSPTSGAVAAHCHGEAVIGFLAACPGRGRLPAL